MSDSLVQKHAMKTKRPGIATLAKAHQFFSVPDPWRFGTERILGSALLTKGYGSDPAIYVSDLQDANKKMEKYCFLHFLIVDGRIWIRHRLRIRIQETQKHTVPTDPDPDTEIFHTK
jgi:hypothetical protein